MKKAVFFLIFTAIIFCLVSENVKNKGSDEWRFLMPDIYGAFMRQSESDFSASVENIKAAITYTNAKSTNKYRLCAILDHVEKHPFDTTAENIKREVVDMFGSCRMFCEGEFWASTNRIYNEYLAKSESKTAEEKGFEIPPYETDARTYWQSDMLSGKVFHQNKYPGKKSTSAFLKGNSCSEKFLAVLLCNGSGKKSVLSADGTLWIYGDNYFMAAESDSSPLFLCLLPGDGADSLRRLENKAVFARKDLTVEYLHSDTSSEIVKVCSPDRPFNFITVERDLLYGFHIYGFDSYRPNVAGKN